jgi:hypothetical protein
MKFKRLSSEQRKERREERRKLHFNERSNTLGRWHTVRLWWPTRVSHTQIMWLEIVARRAKDIRYNGTVREWQYGPATNMLVEWDKVEVFR